MNLWRAKDERSRRRSALGVEGLEGRALLSTITAVPTGTSQRSSKQPAAFKPPTAQPRLFPPYDITAMVESPSSAGSNAVFQGNVQVGGLAFAFSTVWLAEGYHPGYFTNIAQADATGHYAFIVPVGRGTTTLQVFAEAPTQDYSNVETVTVTRGNPIQSWDALALRAIQVQALPAPEAARDLAILHQAQYNAVIATPKGDSAEAAADSAAYSTLTALLPTLSTFFLAAEESAIAGLPLGASTNNGLNLGQQVADQTLQSRANDGSTAIVADPGSTQAGLWRPTPPTFAPAIDPQFAAVRPFALAAPSADRPAAPPALGSAAYDQALAQVATLGAFGSTTRTNDQSLAALFWAENQGGVTDPAHWNAIAEQVTGARRDSLVADARLFDQLDLALADAGIAASDAQYAFGEWRPITAVQQSIPTFEPFLTTPASPSYVSDNATYGAAASRVLTAAFGANVRFTDATEGTAALPRTFPSFAAAASEDGNSRVWGGVNFAFDVQAGATLGDQVGQAVLAGFPKAK